MTSCVPEDSSPLQAGLSLLRLTDSLDTAFQTRIPERIVPTLERFLEQGSWDRIGRILEGCARKDQTGALIASVLATPCPGQQLPLFLAVVNSPAPNSLVSKVIELGAPLVQRADDSHPQFPGATALHIAAARGDGEKTALLAAAGIHPDSPDASGSSPLSYALRTERTLTETPATTALLAAGASLEYVDPASIEGANLRGVTLSGDLHGFNFSSANLIDADLTGAQFNGALFQGATYSPGTRFPAGTHPRFEGFSLGFPLPDSEGTPKWYSQIELSRMYQVESGRLPESLRREADKMVALSGSIEDGCLYCMTYRDNVDFGIAGGNGAAFTQLLPKLLFIYPPGTVSHLLQRIESSMDSLRPPAEVHPNEAEMFALLRHPHDRLLTNRSAADKLTLTLTSITNWLEAYPRTELNRETAYNWGRIGALNFSFLCWKFDAMRLHGIDEQGSRVVKEPALLEKYGMTYLSDRVSDSQLTKDGHSKPFLGKGFLLEPHSKSFSFVVVDTAGKASLQEFDNRTYMELRQAYILVSHPEHGSLLIANESPLFGRGNFEHPAYFSSKGIGNGISIEDLKGITPHNLLKYDFENVLSVELNYYGSNLQPRMGALLGSIEAVKQDYARWKFDTSPLTAFAIIQDESEGTSHRMMRGGYNSPGFQDVVTFLHHRHAMAWSNLREGKSLELPELAFVMPDVPPWVPHSFEDESGFVQHRLTVTSERLSVLQDLAAGVVDQEALTDTGVFQFLQMGFTKQGELILVSPRDGL